MFHGENMAITIISIIANVVLLMGCGGLTWQLNQALMHLDDAVREIVIQKKSANHWRERSRRIQIAHAECPDCEGHLDEYYCSGCNVNYRNELSGA